jgi:hypothetical protein
MFGLRHQIIASVWQSSRRHRANLRFPHVDISFVPTELGSAVWVAPVSHQDADLLRFGRAIPVDVRQRLLALGWSDEATVVTSNDWESVPLTQMPLQHLEPSLGETTSVASPLHALLRQHSSAETQVNNQAKRRSCFPPVVMQLVLEHSLAALHQKDLINRFEWLLTISTIFRDDPAGLVRELSTSLGGENELTTLRLIKNVAFAEVAVPPALAFSAFNSILGYIKTQVRSSSQSQLWRYHSYLSVLSTIAPHVCNFSFREIKKNKVENLILPWEPLDLDDLNIDRLEKSLKVRSAQLRVLESLLQSNPREAYAVKANTVHALPIAVIVGYDASSSLGPTVIALARNWLLLVHRLLSSLNRNYNDRLELEKYLRSVCEILERLGVEDILVTAHCMRSKWVSWSDAEVSPFALGHPLSSTVQLQSSLRCDSRIVLQRLRCGHLLLKDPRLHRVRSPWLLERSYGRFRLSAVCRGSSSYHTRLRTGAESPETVQSAAVSYPPQQRRQWCFFWDQRAQRRSRARSTHCNGERQT